jgi:hypothetical protein
MTMKQIIRGGLMFLLGGSLLLSSEGATIFNLTSAPGAWIGAGQTLSFSNVTASRTGSLGAYTDSVHLSANGYELTLVGPALTLAQAGFYPAATRWPFMGAGPGMELAAPGRANNTLTGCFNVLQAEYDVTGQVAAFAVDFVQYDEGNINNWNRGSIRYNSNIPVPGPLAPIQLRNFGRTNGVAYFTLTGPPNRNCSIETSVDLVSWNPLMPQTISAVGQIALFDAGAVGESQRLYRAFSTSDNGNTGTSNDRFSDRIVIPSTGGTVTGSNTNATGEAGEPNHAGVIGGKSVWWTWTAPASGIVTISLDGSSFDTVLGVYQGSTMESLLPVAQDDDGGVGSSSRVVFSATGGTTYQIAVDGYLGDSGDIKLTLKQGLLNDAFADRLELKGTYDLVIGANVGATYETDEPYHWEATGIHSVWWKWQARQSGWITLSTDGSSFDTILAVYTGDSVSTLSLVANNDDYQTSMTSLIIFFADAGTEYQIAVDGYGTASGLISLFLYQ